MIMMNWQSVGTKVLGITLLALLIMVSCLFGFSVSEKKQNTIDLNIEKSREILLLAEATQNHTSEQWRQGILSPKHLNHLIENKSQSEAKSLVLSTLPIAISWSILKEKARSGKYQFKIAKINARNPNNEPGVIENKALSYFKQNPHKNEFIHMDDETEKLHYFRPVILSKQCELCHGNPENSLELWGNNQGKDLLGFRMDNKREGDLHGAFEIITPMQESFAAVNSDKLTFSGIFLAIVFIVAVIGYIAMSQLIITPLTDLALKLQDISSGEGDLTVRLKAKGKNEFAWVAYSFNTFVKKIAKDVNEIRSTSEKVASASHNLAQISQSTEVGVAAQLAETTQVATAMEEMTATVQEVARNAINASDAAINADSEASSGKNIVTQAVNEINQLASEVENAANVIHELENDSNSIGEVLSVIQGIAEQTNLLALNAAIEAARAGEQGRGFAVVADEVRTLASRTQNSTLEIQQTIDRLQNRAKEAVRVMDNGRKQAASSVEQAASAGESINLISERIDTITDMNNQIAGAAEEQTAVAEEINRNVNNISMVSTQTANGAKDTSSACKELSDLADKLLETIGHFKT